MSLHIGEITSQVTVEGTPGGQNPAAGGGDKPQPWDLLESHRRLTERDHDDRRRTAGEGFDG